MQMIHNCTLFSNLSHHDQVTQIFKKLHWLPVFKWVEYTIILLTFKGLNSFAPVYIREMLTVYKPSRSLGTSENNLLYHWF